MTVAAAPVRATAHRADGSRLAHTGLLLRLIARRERLAGTCTVLIFAVLGAATAASIAQSYATPRARAELAAGPAANTAFRFLVGNLGDADSTAALAHWRAGLFFVAATAVCVATMVVRHTRREEELGRTELIRAGTTGVVAPLAAAAIAATILTVLVAVAMTLVLTPLGGGRDIVSIAAVFTEYAATGLAAVGIALVAAQIATTGRIASLLAVSVLVAGYLLRGIADTIGGWWGWLAWMSPLGWAEHVDAFGGNDFRPALASVAIFVVGLAGAAALAIRRDLGAGILAPRPGPAGTRRLRSIGAVTARLQAPLLGSWVYGVAVYGLIVGLMAPSVDRLVAGNAQASAVLHNSGVNGDLSDMFLFTMMSLLAVAAATWPVYLAGRMRVEETAGRSEVLLATPVGRTRFLLAYWGCGVIGAFLAIAAAALTMALGAAIAGGSWSHAIAHTTAAAGATAAAIALVGAAAMTLYACAPTMTVLGWFVVGLSLILGPLAGMFDLPQWIRDFSPFTHSAAIPMAPMQWTPPLVMVVLGALLMCVAVLRFRRRDLG